MSYLQTHWINFVLLAVYIPFVLYAFRELLHMNAQRKWDEDNR